MKRQVAEEAKKRAEEESKKQAAEEARRKAEEETRKKAEADAKRRAEEERRAREEALEAQLEAEHNSRETNRYVGAIKNQIQRHWLQPPNLDSRLKCTLLVRLLPTGEVISGSVRITRSSGQPGFDRSVEAAVYKASPLPVPRGGLFESFRELELVFDPGK